MNHLLKKFSKNIFDPTVNNVHDIPDEPGNYIICLKKNSKFPKTAVKPVFKTYNGLRVIYTGIAGTSLRKRDYHQHFTKNNAGSSTLRKSLGSLLGYNKIARDKNAINNKTKFNLEDEIKLSAWMQNNLIMFYYPNAECYKNEILLITHFTPPLNIDKNENSEFKNYLKLARAKTVTQNKTNNNKKKSYSNHLNSNGNFQRDIDILNGAFKNKHVNSGCLNLLVVIIVINLFIFLIYS